MHRDDKKWEMKSEEEEEEKEEDRNIWMQ